MNVYDRPRVIYRDDSGKLAVGRVTIIQYGIIGINISLWEADKENPRQLYFGHDEIGFNLFLDSFVMNIKNYRGHKEHLYDNDIVRVYKNVQGIMPNEKDYTDHLITWIGDCSSNPCFDLLPHPDGVDYNGIEWMIDSVDVREIEIIGNKHQNRELVPEAALKALET